MKILFGCWTIVFCVLTAQIFWLALWYQIYGSVPVSHGVNLFFNYWQFSVPISRLWDLLLGPAYLLVSEMIFKCEWLMDEDDIYQYWEKIPGTLNGFGTILFLSVTFGFLGASFGGVAYFVPVSILAMVTLFVFAVLLAIWLSFHNRL